MRTKCSSNIIELHQELFCIDILNFHFYSYKNAMSLSYQNSVSLFNLLF